jgi:hypothetical protein
MHTQNASFFTRLCGAILLALPAFSQTPCPVLSPPPDAVVTPFEIEGPVTSIVRRANSICGVNQAAEITVMGNVILVPIGTPVASPTAQLTFRRANPGATAAPAAQDQWARSIFNTATLPGRTQAGFVGGTAIMLGSQVFDAATGTYRMIAEDVFLEPAENVLRGQKVAVPAGDARYAGAFMRVGDTPILAINDARMPIVAFNGYGFPIDYNGVANNTFAMLGGYYSGPAASQKYYAHTLEADNGQLLPLTAEDGSVLEGGAGQPAVGTLPRVSIQRYNCLTDARVNGDFLQVQGSVLFGANRAAVANARVRLQFVFRNGQTRTTATGAITPATPPAVANAENVPVVADLADYGTWRIRVTDFNLNGNACPVAVRANYVTPNGTGVTTHATTFHVLE